MKPLRLPLLLLAVALAAVFGLAWQAEQRRADNAEAAAGQLRDSISQARVLVRAVDGDTVELDGKERVRILNISVPESWRKTDKGKWERIPDPDPRAIAAYEFLRSFEGQKVRVTFDVDKRDRYGRTLAHLYAIGEGLDLGAEIVRRGWGTPSAIGKNHSRYQEYKILASAEK